MAAEIKVKGTATAAIGDSLYGLELCLVLEDDGKEIQATWEIDTVGESIPLMGITQYGRITSLVGSVEMDYSVTITATPLGGTSDDSVSATVGILDLYEAVVGTSLSGD